jgi:hypothetical protein
MGSVSRYGTALLAVAGLTAGVALIATPAGAGVPPHPAYKTTAPAGTSNGNLLMAGWTDPKTGFNVRQNMWNCPNNCGAQTLWANSASSWGVVSDQPKGNTAVLAYPDVQDVLTLSNGNPAPLSGFKAITASFKQSQPKVGDFEAAFDIWLNNWNTEIMIWTQNHGQVPLGSVAATLTSDGRRWALFANPGSSGGYPGGPFSFAMRGGESTGTIHILTYLRYLIQHKFIPANSTIDDVEYGWEICSTGGKAEDFDVKSYALTVQG